MKAFAKLIVGLAIALIVLWIVERGFIPFHPRQPDWSRNGLFQLEQFAVILLLGAIIIAKIWSIATAAAGQAGAPHVTLRDIGMVFATIFASIVMLAAAFAVARKLGEPFPPTSLSAPTTER